MLICSLILFTLLACSPPTTSVQTPTSHPRIQPTSPSIACAAPVDVQRCEEAIQSGAVMLARLCDAPHEPACLTMSEHFIGKPDPPSRERGFHHLKRLCQVHRHPTACLKLAMFFEAIEHPDAQQMRSIRKYYAFSCILGEVRACRRAILYSDLDDSITSIQLRRRACELNDAESCIEYFDTIQQVQDAAVHSTTPAPQPTPAELAEVR